MASLQKKYLDKELSYYIKFPTTFEEEGMGFYTLPITLSYHSSYNFGYNNYHGVLVFIPFPSGVPLLASLGIRASTDLFH